MMIRSIINTLKKNIPEEKAKVLGRWKIENCSKRMNSKVDMANEDHCGPCGEYAITKRKSETYKEETNHKKF